MNTPSKLKNRLEMAMREAGFDRQEDLEIASGVSQGTISRIWNEKNIPKSTTLEKLADACNVTVIWLAHGWLPKYKTEIAEDQTGYSGNVMEYEHPVEGTSIIENKLPNENSHSRTNIHNTTEKSNFGQNINYVTTNITRRSSPHQKLPQQQRTDDFKIAPIKIPILNFGQIALILSETDLMHLTSTAEYWIYADYKEAITCIALKVEENSMDPEFKKGDIIIVNTALSPRAGDFVIARTRRDEVVFKKYRRRGLDQRGNEIFELMPLNNDYETIRSDQQRLTIIGVVVEHRRTFTR